jgi:hypothetical protein
MNADGTGKRTLFHRGGFSAFSGVFSPKGDELALSVGRYFRAPGPPPGQLALIKPDGSDFRLIVDDGVNNRFPTWSPDATHCVQRGNQLVIMRLADRSVTPLTDGSTYDNFPQWSPTGDTIMFTSYRDGDFELYTIRPDGSGLRRLTDAPGNDAHSAWCSDGQWIVFSSARMGFKDELALYDAVRPYGEMFAIRAGPMSGAHRQQVGSASPACLALPPPTLLPDGSQARGSSSHRRNVMPAFDRISRRVCSDGRRCGDVRLCWPPPPRKLKQIERLAPDSTPSSTPRSRSGSWQPASAATSARRRVPCGSPRATIFCSTTSKPAGG